jgi:hypothetical protein
MRSIHWHAAGILRTRWALKVAPVPQQSRAIPAKGIFICGSGGRTRLHVDPRVNDACLCQAAGNKRFIMFAPEAGSLLSDGERGVVNPRPAGRPRVPALARGRSGARRDAHTEEPVPACGSVVVRCSQ